MTERSAFKTRTITLYAELQRNTLMAIIPNLPLSDDKPLEVVIREPVKVRKPDANARMWAGPLRDIAEQAWVNGRQFSAEVWHEHFKREYLPDFDALEFELLTKEGYRKWDIDPAGNRVLIGSTTQLTTRGFAAYLQQIEAEGASLGVMFSANPREGR